MLIRIKILVIVLLIVGAFLTSQSICQTQYFSSAIDLSGEWGMGMTVIASDTSYHLAGIAGPGYNVCVIEVGLSGNVNWIKKYGKPGETWYPGNPGSFKECAAGYFLGGSVGTTDSIYGHFILYNNSFDTILTKRYSNTSDAYLILTNGSRCFGGGFVFTGDISRQVGSPDVLLLKTDSIGNELWRTTKDFGGYDRGWSIIQTPDSGYVIGGYTYIPGLVNSGDPIVMKFNKNGEYLWKKIFGGEYRDEEAMVCLNADSTFTVLTTYIDSMYTPETGYARINLVKLSQEGDIIWNRKYGSSLLSMHISNLKQTSDGGYICCGFHLIAESNHYVGWLFKTDSNDDSLWFRTYMHYSQSEHSIHDIRDVDLASDGGYIATGQAWALPPNNLQKIWVLKVDSIGCDTAGCDPTVGIAEMEPGRRGEWEKGSVELWPNPGSDLIHVSLASRQSAVVSRQSVDRFTMEVYDIFGRKAPIPNLPSSRDRHFPSRGKGEVVLDISSLPPGLYLLVVKDGQTVIASAKFVVAR